MVLAAACLNYGSDCWLPPQHLNHRQARLDVGPSHKREGHEHDVKASQHQVTTIASPTVKPPSPRQCSTPARDIEDESAKGSARKADRHNHVMAGHRHAHLQGPAHPAQAPAGCPRPGSRRQASGQHRPAGAAGAGALEVRAGAAVPPPPQGQPLPEP